MVESKVTTAGPPPEAEAETMNRTSQFEGDDASSTTVGSDDNGVQGTWGEQTGGQPINVRAAREDFDELRRELSNLSRSRSGRVEPVKTRGTMASEATSAPDVEAQHDDEDDEDEFILADFLRDGHFEKRTDGKSAKKVGVVFRNLNVEGVGATSAFVKTLPSAVLGTFGPDLYRNLSRFLTFLPQRGANGMKRDLVHNFTGVVRDGEMMLVLGRPGSGCSTFLKAITNKRAGFASVTGDVHYGGIAAREQLKNYRGEIAYNEEDDQHFPTLTVGQTLGFALENKTKKQSKGEIPIIVDALLKMFGISHTRQTMVGDVFTPGVSGGERKRVSIAETLTTKSTVVAWDNSTRGLDASTALDYAKSLRVMTDVSNRTTLVTLYQAGEGIYEVMDKVLVIDEGRMVYQGLATEAKAYFESLGYYCPPRQTTPDFLTACTDPIERRFQQDFQGPIPKGSIELEKAFLESQAYQKVLQDVESYEKSIKDSDLADAREFKQSVRETKSKTVSKKSSYTVSFVRQVLACTKREFWLTFSDRSGLYSKLFTIISNSLIVGSLFYNQSNTTSGTFSRGGTLFFSTVFLGWLQLGELIKAIGGRNIIQRHNEYAFYHPSAVVIGRVVQDFPILIFEVILFSIIVYFLTNLSLTAGKFFIYALLVLTNTIMLTAMYRMFASISPNIDDAVRFAGTALQLLFVYTGYVIPKPILLGQKIWFGWIYYINPMAYSFEAILSNEFSGQEIECAPSQTVPYGPGYDNPTYQGCAVPGSVAGSLQVNGDSFLATSYEYSRQNLWRNFGIVIAFTVAYIAITMLASEKLNFAAGGGGLLEFKKSKAAKNKIATESAPVDEEKVVPANTSSASSGDDNKAEDATAKISGSESIFTWNDVEFSVPFLGGEKKLLNKVSGYAKPGVMVALMGASGAGKTTLLNTLSQRQSFGVVKGDMLVDGRPLSADFQRGTGFCEQMDLHDGTATIREAFEFSAILRQERDVPREEKIAYVDTIIDLLELNDIQDALVRSLGVEQRKRVTIGVELAAKPNLLLFLDEPTSGLDSQSAYSIVRFLRKLAQAGQAIVCTIHQPSSVLIQEFDMLLALNPGGNTFYFGPVGENGSAITKYFADRGIQCPPHQNVAEFLLETAAKPTRGPDGKRINWNREWVNSKEGQAVKAEIARVNEERSKVEPPSKDNTHEFAAGVWLQTTELTKRMFINHWREPSYLYGKLFVAVIIGIFNGFTYWKLGNTVTDMQNRMFTSFLILLVPVSVVNAVIPKFYGNRALWEFREHPSRIYGWVAFCTANVVSEIPMAIFSSVIYWALWYWPTGLATDSSSSGYVFLMTMLFFLFQASWGQWICAFAPSFTVIQNVLPTFFVAFSLFNGVVQPYGDINVFWRYWMYYLNPSTYWIGGVIAATLNNVVVECAPNEEAYFNPPPGQTCQDYAQSYLNSIMRGTLTNPDATSDCAFCPYANGIEYMQTLNVKPSDKWPYFGIFLAFCISNWALVYFFIYTVRVKGWSFGLGFLFGLIGKTIGAVKGLFTKKSKTEEEE